MLRLHEGTQTAFRHVRVDLRGGDVGVSQQSLHRAQIGAAFDEMGRKSVPQDVRAHARRVHAGLRRRRLQHLRNTPTRELSIRSARRWK